MRKIKKYLSPSGSLPKPNLFQRPDGSYFYTNNGEVEVNVTPLNKLTDNPAEWTYTDETGRIYTPKKEYKNTYALTESNPTTDYHNYLNLKDKSSRDKTMAKAYLENGNLYDAFMSYIGMRAPKNPFVITGEPTILPGRATPLLVQLSAKLMETINNYWNKLGKLKIRLGGNGKYASGILTKPGTAPTTFNGLNISYITSPKGGNVTHKFYTDLGSEYILTKDGFARRIKTPHANTGGADAGLHDWNLGKTYFLNDKGDFSGQFRLIKEKVPNIAVATGKDGKMYFMNTDTNKLILNEEIFPKAVEKGILSKGYYNIPYSQEPKLGYSLFEFGTNGTTGKINWYHPGSSVAFIEGLKQGGKMNTLQFLKNGSGIHIKKKNRGKFTDYCGGLVTQECINKGKHSSNPAIRKRATFADNARKWKHKNGGKAFVEGVNVLDSNPNAYKYVKKKYKMHLKGGNLVINYIKAIENPNKVGWNGKVWQAPNLKGYDVNLRGYGIDINTNLSAKKLTNGRPGRWMTDAEASKLMNEHINYITTAANKHIKGFNKLSPQRQAALLGMLYRGDSVNKSGINYLVGDDKKFFTSIGNYYRSKGLNERANNSDKFFGKYLLKGGSIDWTSTLANVGSSILQGYFLNRKISREAEAAKAMNKLTSKDFFDIYNLKLQEAKQLEEQLAKATEAIIGTTINPSNIVAANNAWKNASGEYAALKNNVDLQNRVIDAEAQALKSNIWGNAISGIMLLGMGILNSYLSNKSSLKNAPTTISTKTSYNYFSTPKKFGTFNNDGSMNLGYNMTWSTDKGVQTKKWSDNISIFNKSLTDYLK